MPRRVSTTGALPTQTQNPYSYGPTVYVPVAGSGSAAAPGPALTPGPVSAPVAGPLAAAVGPSAFGAAPAPGPSALGPVAAQAAMNTSFGETQLTGVGPIYKKQDSLEPVRALALPPAPAPCDLLSAVLACGEVLWGVHAKHHPCTSLSLSVLQNMHIS